MQEHHAAILKSLIAVAWADKTISKVEHDMIEGLIAGFGLTEKDAGLVREYARIPRGLDEIPLSALSREDRQLLYYYVSLLAQVDERLMVEEMRVLVAIEGKLGLEKKQYVDIAKAAKAQIEKHKTLL